MPKKRKKVSKKCRKKLTLTKRFGILVKQPRKRAWKQEMIFEN